MNPSLPDRFNFITTQDGSPSLRFKEGAEAFSESMHNLSGAFGETIYIYGRALDTMVEKGLKPHVLSLGLGLGYNEILAAACLTKHSLTENAQIDSFEIDAQLREFFAAWITNKTIPKEFKEAYDQILERAAAQYDVSRQSIQGTLQRWLESDQLRLREALSLSSEFDRRYSCYLFDAFSSKTSPELWTEDFLKTFLTKTSERQAVFSTYACTGALKRSLRELEFELDIREGYSSKRDCTFATRFK